MTELRPKLRYFIPKVTTRLTETLKEVIKIETERRVSF